MKDQAALSAEWHRLARRTVWKVNLGWWLERLTPLLVGSGVVGFTLIFWLRSRGLNLGLSETAPWLAGALVLLMIAAALWARKHFLTGAGAMVRLESQLHLHNALTVALAGRGAWPQMPNQIDDGWRWRWQRVGGPISAFAACLAAALWIPISQEASASLPTVEPQSWAQMQDWLEKLKEESLITPEEKKEEEAKIAELREQPKEKWFGHESLNASDTLKEQLQRDIQNMGQNLSNAERSLNALQNYADKLSMAAKEQLLKNFDEAVAGMQAGSLALDPELLKELSQVDPKNLPSMSQDQFKQLRESLKKKSGALDGMAKNPGFLGDGEGEDDALAEMMGELRKNGQGHGEGQGDGDGDGPGNGGISRGPGTAPLTLSDEENRFGTNKNEAVSNPDLARAQLGDMVGLKDGKHEVDRTAAGVQAAGSIKAAGDGGEQVWKESLTPEEKAVLKRVFQ